MQHIEHDSPIEVPVSFGPTGSTLKVARRPVKATTQINVCRYCADPDCDNPLFCAAYEPPLLDTVPMNGVGELLIGAVKDTWGNALFNNHMLLYLEISGVVSTIVLHPSQRIVLGRLREEQACERILDLTPYDARQNGVSRVHASITQQGHTLWLSDLGSTNGTYLNDQRLLLNQPRLLRDGDHIFLGNLSALVRFG